ncbi:MAG: hypothetical protein ACO3G4_01695, partial [Opitutaceae bacterium]
MPNLLSRFPRPRPALWLSLAVLLTPLAARAQATGTVTGQVSNAATAVFLDGAEVSVEGTG